MIAPTEGEQASEEYPGARNEYVFAEFIHSISPFNFIMHTFRDPYNRVLVIRAANLQGSSKNEAFGELLPRSARGCAGGSGASRKCNERRSPLGRRGVRLRAQIDAERQDREGGGS